MPPGAKAPPKPPTFTYKTTSDAISFTTSYGVSYTAKFDGKDYPIKGDNTADTVSTGEPSTDMVILDGKDHDNSRRGDKGEFIRSTQRIDASHLRTTFKKDGKEYQRAEASLSADGKTETEHQWGTGRTSGKPFDVTLVYEKQ